MPCHPSAVHLMLPDASMYRVVSSVTLLIMGKDQRVRTRIHVGSPLECQYKMKYFGIQADLLPTSIHDMSEQSKKKYTQWVHMMQTCDQERWTQTDESIVDCPFNEDVLFGKGFFLMKHVGNIAMRRLVEERLQIYEKAPFKEKSSIAWEVVLIIQKGGGRFLKEDPTYGWFVQVDDEIARQKVSIAFRDGVKKLRSQRHDTVKSSSSTTSNNHRGAAVEIVVSRSHDIKIQSKDVTQQQFGDNNDEFFSPPLELLERETFVEGDRSVINKRRKIEGGIDLKEM
jgi:hypothetical protein